MLGTDSLIHDDLQQVCQNHGGYLPEPKDENENNFLNDLGTGAFLLGMTDTATDGTWVWDSDGTEVTWSLWQPWGEPNGGDGESCVMMAKSWWDSYGGHNPRAWGDIACDFSAALINSRSVNLVCERNPGLFTLYHLVLLTDYLKSGYELVLLTDFL